jgi:glycosyl-4,4'-diaponeurosporenoate acyltransferase
MFLYALIILIFSTIACVLGCFIGVPVMDVAYGWVFATTGLYFVGLFLIDAIVAITVRAFPKSWYNPFKKIYAVKDKERKFYDKLKIRTWKDKIPETGKFLVGFSKSKVECMTDNKYVEKFMYETVYAEVMHFFSIPFSFFTVFIYPKLFLFCGIPMILGNIIMQALPVMVQRYNRFKLMILHKRNQRTKLAVKPESINEK